MDPLLLEEDGFCSSSQFMTDNLGKEYAAKSPAFEFRRTTPFSLDLYKILITSPIAKVKEDDFQDDIQDDIQDEFQDKLQNKLQDDVQNDAGDDNQDDV